MSEAIRLQEFTPDHAEDLYKLVDTNRERLKVFPWTEQTRSADDSLRFIEAVQATEQSNGAPTRGIYTDESLIGVTALHTIDWKHRSSLMGYWIDKDQSGRGYATSAASAMINIAFNDLQLDQVRLCIQNTNTASRGIAHKLGFEVVFTTAVPEWKTSDPVVATSYVLTAQNWPRS